ncbi:MAG: carbohydrate kinase family protein [Vicinamibacterales bacterium]
MNIIVTGSIAFDYLMSFPGKFTEHFLPEHMNRVSLSFLVDSMDKRRGGCAPNIAYSLALLGERPKLMGTAGQDFDDYRRWLEAAGVDTSLVKQVEDKFTASFFCSTDADSNQIASFYTGAMANAAELSFRTVGAGLAIISPNDPAAMLQYAEECRTLGVPYIWDPGQQCARMSGDELRDGLVGATLVICNDYEYALIQQKTGLDEAGILAQTRALVVTRGEDGSSIHETSGRVDVAAVPPHRIVDPTGVGDAFRSGFLKGMANGASYLTCARLGSVAAAFALEHLGGQSHAYTWDEFSARYAGQFGEPPPLT